MEEAKLADVCCCSLFLLVIAENAFGMMQRGLTNEKAARNTKSIINFIC
tara:strand:+ start:36 stop:182 length:147 start_codon:yes stop_codon:yes gene_type:complete